MMLRRSRLPLCAFAALLAAPYAGAAQEFDCLIEARQAVEIRSPVEAVIEQVHVRRGDLVLHNLARRALLLRAVPHGTGAALG
jgi:hypothetical protein